MIACAKWLGREPSTCTRGKDNCVCQERGNQRYCTHHFTGGACVMCHYNPWKNKGGQMEVEHDELSSRRYKEDFDGLCDQMKIAEANLAKMKEILRVIAYPKRGTEEETDYVFVQDVANYIQSNFSLEDLQ